MLTKYCVGIQELCLNAIALRHGATKLSKSGVTLIKLLVAIFSVNIIYASRRLNSNQKKNLLSLLSLNFHHMPFCVNRPEYQKACQGWSDHQKTQQGSLQSQMPQVPGSSPQGQTYGPRKEEGYCQCPYARKGEIFSLICIPIIWRCLLQQTTISLFLS